LSSFFFLLKGTSEAALGAARRSEKIEASSARLGDIPIILKTTNKGAGRFVKKRRFSYFSLFFERGERKDVKMGGMGEKWLGWL